VEVIFDVGANVGKVARNFSVCFPNAQIYCFEPVSKTYCDLCEATAKNANISCFKCGISDFSGVARISSEKNSERSRIIEKHGDGEDSKEQIELTTIDKFCEAHAIKRIDMVKTDTEGYDLQVLRGVEEMLRTGTSFVLCEIGMDRSDTRHAFFQGPLKSLKQL
jgi:FkbM family methyltransferase